MQALSCLHAQPFAANDAAGGSLLALHPTGLSQHMAGTQLDGKPKSPYYKSFSARLLLLCSFVIFCSMAQPLQLIFPDQLICYCHNGCAFSHANIIGDVSVLDSREPLSFEICQRVQTEGGILQLVLVIHQSMERMKHCWNLLPL